MPFSGTMYSEVSAGAYQIDDLLRDFNIRIERLRSDSDRLVSEMTVFGIEWGPIVSAADALLTADPDDAAKQNLSAHITNLVEDYNTLNTRAQSVAAAINSALGGT